MPKKSTSKKTKSRSRKETHDHDGYSSDSTTTSDPELGGDSGYSDEPETDDVHVAAPARFSDIFRDIFKSADGWKVALERLKAWVKKHFSMWYPIIATGLGIAVPIVGKKVWEWLDAYMRERSEPFYGLKYLHEYWNVTRWKRFYNRVTSAKINTKALADFKQRMTTMKHAADWKLYPPAVGSVFQRVIDLINQINASEAMANSTKNISGPLKEIVGVLNTVITEPDETTEWTINLVNSAIDTLHNTIETTKKNIPAPNNAPNKNNTPATNKPPNKPLNKNNNAET